MLLHTFDLKHTELYDAIWRSTDDEKIKAKKGVSPGRKITDFSKKEQEKKFFRPMGGFNIASEIINSEAGCTPPRVLTKTETFGQKIQVEDEKKKKKKKKNKDKDKEDNNE